MSLQVWLPLNGNLNNQGLSDTSISILNSADFNDNGKIGKALFIDNNNKGVSIDNYMNQLKTYNNYSMCAWIYLDSNNTSGHSSSILSSGNWNTAAGQVCFALNNFSTDGYTKILIPNTTGWSQGITLSTENKILLNKWYHISIIYNGTKTIAYINGKQVGTYNGGGIGQSSESNHLYIGRATYSTTFTLKGKINDVRIYDHALSPKEVREISKGLVLHYKMNDRFIEQTTNLCKGSNCGSGSGTWGAHKYTAVLQNCTINDPVPFNQKTVLTFDYNTSYGSGGGGSVYPPQTFKVSPSTQYCYSKYIKASDDFSNASANLLYRYEYASSGGTRLIEGGVFSTSRREYVGNGWYRCWGTFTTQATTAYLSLPSYNYPGHSCVYEIGGIQLEPKDHMTPYVLGQFRPDNKNLIIDLIKGGQTTVSNNTVITSGVSADTYFYLKLSEPLILDHSYKLSWEASGITDGQHFVFPVAGQSNTSIGTITIKNGYNEFVFQANTTCVNAGTSIIMDDSGRPSTITQATFSNFKLIDITNNIYDSSGFNYNGSIIGNVTNDFSPRYQDSLYLNGKIVDTGSNTIIGASYLESIIPLTTPDQITISWWGKIDQYGRGGIINTSATDHTGTDYNTTLLSNWDSYFRLYNGTGFNIGVNKINPDNNWHHHVITYNGAKACYYQDGILNTSADMTGNLPTINSIIIGLGHAGGVYRQIKQHMSDFRVYCTALSAEDVKELYNTSAAVDNMSNGFAREVIE